MTTTQEWPAESAGELYYPTPVTPEEAFQAIGRLRKDARDEIDRLIRFLDETDNHMELEPTLGFPENHPAVIDTGSGSGWPYYTSEGGQSRSSGGTDDREDEADAGPVDDNELEGDDTPDGDSADAEPSLGSGATGIWTSQAQWALRGSGEVDAEEEHDGREPDEADNEESIGFDGTECDRADEEPSLGWGLNGEMGNESGSDRELQNHATVAPKKNRRKLSGTIDVENQVGGRKTFRRLSKRQTSLLAERIDRHGTISLGLINTRGLL